MSFLYPTFLYALAAVAIPIIIHLFNFRRHKTVLFSSVRYLRNIKKETKAKSQLKHFLILLARILTVVTLVLAFARPYLPVAGEVEEPAEQVVAIYVDNSFSMDAQNKYGQLLEVAKSKVSQIADAFRPDSRFLFLNNDFDGKHNQFVNREQMMDFVAWMSQSPSVRKTSEVLTRLNDFASRNQAAKGELQRVFMLSDFQKSSTDINQLESVSDLDVVMVPLSTQATNNMFIDTCWFEMPGRKYNHSEELFARVVNNSDEVYTNIPIKLFIDDSLKFLGSFTVKAQSEEVVKLSYTNSKKGVVNGRVEISDYPVTYDNTFYFNYRVASQIRVLSVSEQAINPYINALFADDDYFHVSHAVDNRVNFSDFSNNHLIIISELRQLSSGLVQELDKYLANGGAVLFFPALDGSIPSYNQMFSHFATSTISVLDTHRTRVNHIDYEHPVFDEAFKKADPDIDLPDVFTHFVFESQTRANDETILETIDGHPFLRKVGYGKGSLYVSAVPLDDESSDFASHPVFVPAVYNMAFNAQGNTSLYYTLGRLDKVKLNLRGVDGNQMVHVVSQDGSFDFIPDRKSVDSQTNLEGEINEAGNYLVKVAETPIEGLAINYNRQESNLSCYSNNELKELIEEHALTSFSVLEGQQKEITESIEEFNQGKQLWRWFLMFALLFILAEVALIRLMK